MRERIYLKLVAQQINDYLKDFDSVDDMTDKEVHVAMDRVLQLGDAMALATELYKNQD